MNSEVIRVYKTVHTWTGIVSGLALFIAFYAGALTVFKEPLVRWASPPGTGSVEEVSLADTPELIAQTLAAYPEAAGDFRLHLKPSEHLNSRLSWELQDNNEEDDHGSHGKRHFVATLQADGRLSGTQIHPSQLAEFIDTLHRVVGLPFDTEANRWVMGLIAVLYSIALVSGVIVLLPTLIKDFFALRLGKNLKRMWLDAHNVVGIISLPLHLVMALTAVVFAYHDGIYMVQDKVIHEGKLRQAFQSGILRAAADQSTDPVKMLAPAVLVARAQALSPTFEPYMLQYVGVTTPRATVRVWGHDETSIVSRAWGGFAPINPYTGDVMSLEYMPGRQSVASATISSFFSLHFATFGGNPVRWMYFLLALAGAWLFYSGNLLWVESRRKKQKRNEATPEQKRNTQVMSALTVGVCLGCIGGISLSMVAGKWLHNHVVDLTDWHMGIYYTVFFSSIVWALRRGAAKASVELLWVAAIFTLLIPITTLIAWISPSLGLWAHTSLGALSVDITALVGSLAFIWMARATSKRIYFGPKDSVWSAATKPV